MNYRTSLSCKSPALSKKINPTGNVAYRVYFTSSTAFANAFFYCLVD